MEEFKHRQRVLTKEDVEAIAEAVRCNHNTCPFSGEEVQFVRDWLETAKTAKSEVIRWVVRLFLLAVGLIAGVQVAIKMGWFKLEGK
jgi:hypothetical protein